MLPWASVIIVPVGWVAGPASNRLSIISPTTHALLRQPHRRRAGLDGCSLYMPSRAAASALWSWAPARGDLQTPAGPAGVSEAPDKKRRQTRMRGVLALVGAVVCATLASAVARGDVLEHSKGYMQMASRNGPSLHAYKSADTSLGAQSPTPRRQAYVHMRWLPALHIC